MLAESWRGVEAARSRVSAGSIRAVDLLSRCLRAGGCFHESPPLSFTREAHGLGARQHGALIEIIIS